MSTDIENLRTQLRQAYSLLDQAIVFIPAYIDGRNDSLLDAIEAWLSENEKELT